MVVVSPTNEYIIYVITNLDADYGMHSLGPKIFLNWSDDMTNWHEGGLLMHPAFNVSPTNAHRYYKFNRKPLVADGVGPVTH